MKNLTRDNIQGSIQNVIRSFKSRQTQVATRAEQEQSRLDQELAEVAADTSVEGVASELSALQLHFDANLSALATRVSLADEKLVSLQSAVAIEGDRISQLDETLVMAEALELHRQDHASQISNLKGRHNDELLAITTDAQETQALWDAKASKHDTERQARLALESSERATHLESASYDLKLRRQQTSDSQMVTQRALERELEGEVNAQTKQWTQRAGVLDAASDEIKKLKASVALAPTKLSEAVEKARAGAISKNVRQCELEKELQAQENAATKSVNALEKTALEKRIEAQIARSEELAEQLQKALEQAQTLASSALKKTAA